MYIPTTRSDHSKGGGGEGGGGGNLNSGKSDSSSGNTISDVGGLHNAEGNAKATAYGEGVGVPTKGDGGHFNASSNDDDVTGDEVYGINHRVGGYSDLNDTWQLGGEELEVTTARDGNNGVLMFFVSNEYNAVEVQGAIRGGVAVGNPFNSTNGLQLGTAAQFFSGGGVAALLRGYDGAGGLSGSQNSVPNSPSPLSPNISTWLYQNSTIGSTLLSALLPVLPYRLPSSG